MKKTFTFILSVVLCTGLYAQNENYSPQLKSTLSDGQQPDSTIIWIMDNVWVPQSKFVYSYDGNKTESISYYWDTETSAWIIQIKSLENYNENGDMLNQLRMVRNSSQWDTLSNMTYTYDDILGITSWDYDSWNQTTHDWNDLMKGEYDYFENGHDCSYLFSQWNASLARWDSISLTVMIMNENGKDSIGTYYKWTTQAAPKYIDYHYAHSYDESGNDTLYIQEDPANPDEKYKRVTIFNINGFKINDSYYDWVDNAWLGTYRTEYDYDEHDNLVLMTSQEWNATGQEWLSVRKEQHYYTIETAIKEFYKPELLVYPNPASDYLMIKFDNALSSATFRLYTVDGIKVIDQKIFSNVIPVGHLPKGVYLYQFDDSGMVFSGKVVLK